MTESDEQELREFMRLKHHSHELTNQQLGQFPLFRDQGVGGSNPLSPTNSFKQLERFQHPQFWVQWVQLAISVPQWACGNRVLLALP